MGNNSVSCFSLFLLRFITVLTDLYKGWTDEESFKFWVPAQAVKLSKAEDGKPNGKRWIQGIASTDHRDLQGETVAQDGIDFTYFLKHGYFNNDHKPGFENKVGEPTECKVTKQGLWVKGFLYDDPTNCPVADSIWKLMHAQESTEGARRKVGFSIEGKVKRRNGQRIESCWIQDIAITPAPVNTASWAEIAKSLSAQPWITREETTNEVLKSEPLGVVSKSLTLQETATYIETTTGVGKEDASTLARLIFTTARQGVNQ